MNSRSQSLECTTLVVWVAVLLLAVALAACTGQQEPTAVHVPAATTPPLVDQVAIPINLKGANNVGSLHIELVYDPAILSAAGVEAGQLAGNAVVESSLETPGRVIVGVIDAMGVSGDGPVATVSFEVLDAGGESPLSLENLEANHCETLFDILVQASAGIFQGSDSSFTAPAVNFGESADPSAAQPTQELQAVVVSPEPTVLAVDAGDDVPWQTITVSSLGVNFHLPVNWRYESGQDFLLMSVEPEEIVAVLTVSWYPMSSGATVETELQHWMGNHPDVTWSELTFGMTSLGPLVWCTGTQPGVLPIWAAMVGPTRDGDVLYWWGQAPQAEWNQYVGVFSQIMDRTSYLP